MSRDDLNNPATQKSNTRPNLQRALLVLLALLNGLLYATLIPPWLSPDEHGHFEYAALTAQLGHVPNTAEISPELEQEIIASMRAARLWELAFHRSPPTEPIASFLDDSDLAHSGRQVGNEPPLYYLLAAIIYHLTANLSIEVQLYAMRLMSVLMFALIVLVISFAAQDLFPQRKGLQITITALVALHPMLTYVGASINNDILGTLTTSIFFWILIRLVRYGVHWRRLAALIAVIALNLASTQQCLFIIPTLVLLALFIAVKRERRLWAWATLASAIAVMVISIVLLSLLPSKATQNWAVRPSFQLAERTSTTARSGGFSLLIPGSTDQKQEVIQPISNLLEQLGGQKVILSAYVRSTSGTQDGYLFIRDDSGTATAPFSAGETWAKATLIYTVPRGARFLSVGLIAEQGGQGLYADDISLTLAGENQPDLLSNGSAELTASQLDRLLADTLYLRLGLPWNFHRTIFDASHFELEALLWYYQSFQTLYDTFWGVFAYLSVLLPQAWYRLIGILIALAFAGWVRLGWLRWRRRTQDALATWQWRALAVLGLGSAIDLAMLVMATVLRSDRWWQPQGRYLFPLMLPFAVFLGLGWQSLLPRRLQPYSTVVVVSIFWVYNLACLVFLIVPYCYGAG